MGKYELLLRRTTQVEMSVGIMRSRFETYPPQQFDLMDILDTPITLGSHVVTSGPRTLEERIELGQDWEQWLASVEDVEEEERSVAVRADLGGHLKYSQRWSVSGRTSVVT